MDKENWLKYSPIIVVVMGFFLSYNIFVTPSDLEQRFNKYDEHIETMYATKAEVTRHQKQLDDIFAKIDKIYDFIISKK